MIALYGWWRPIMANVPVRKGARSRTLTGPFLAAALGWALLGSGVPQAAGPSANAPDVEIKKHSTGKEATIRHGEKEWYIYIDVDDNRTMIIRTESKGGKETGSTPEVIERPMSNTEVDRIISDWASGIKSTLKP
jgi:hypothetical protein